MLRYTNVPTTNGAIQQLAASCTFTDSTTASCVTELTAMGSGKNAPATSTAFASTYGAVAINAAQAVVTAGAEKLILPPSCAAKQPETSTTAAAGGVGAVGVAGGMGLLGGLLALVLL